MRNWDINSLSVSPHAPEIPGRLEPTARVLSSSSDAGRSMEPVLEAAS